MDNFFSAVYQAILRLIPFQTLKAIVIASPGFTKDSVGSRHLLELYHVDDVLVVRLYLSASYFNDK
jgi:stalled ribosome rescue protein Dom34